METLVAQNVPNYDIEKERRAFDETKMGVKGLVDAGIAHIPSIFMRPPEEVDPSLIAETPLEIPIIDLKHMHEGGANRKELVEKIREASETWGMFQIVNHGLPEESMENLFDGVRRFFDEPDEVKMKCYTRDNTGNCKYVSNFDLYDSKFANWRDTLLCVMEPNAAREHPEDIPDTCREAMLEYSKDFKSLGLKLYEFLSEGLGLKPSHLADIGCAAGHIFITQYYPPSPEPEKTVGTSEHTDPDFLTILLPDKKIGGLQVLYQKKWVDIPVNPDALVVNIGDILQLVTNDRYISAKHRVLSNKIGTRCAVAGFFTTHFKPYDKIFGPIKELCSEDNPPLYKETKVSDYLGYFNAKGVGTAVKTKPALSDFRL